MKSKFFIAAAVFATAFTFPASAWSAVTFAASTQYAAGVRPLAVAMGDFG